MAERGSGEVGCRPTRWRRWRSFLESSSSGGTGNRIGRVSPPRSGLDHLVPVTGSFPRQVTGELQSPDWVRQSAAGFVTDQSVGRSSSSSRRMGLLSWVKRHYYHYSISTGTYSFYPVESVMVNACTFTLFSLLAYYIVRSVWFGALFIGDLVSPQSSP